MMENLSINFYIFIVKSVPCHHKGRENKENFSFKILHFFWKRIRKDVIIHTTKLTRIKKRFEKAENNSNVIFEKRHERPSGSNRFERWVSLTICNGLLHLFPWTSRFHKPLLELARVPYNLFEFHIKLSWTWV